jgi:hypothetical protein
MKSLFGYTYNAMETSKIEKTIKNEIKKKFKHKLSKNAFVVGVPTEDGSDFSVLFIADGDKGFFVTGNMIFELQKVKTIEPDRLILILTTAEDGGGMDIISTETTADLYMSKFENFPGVTPASIIIERLGMVTYALPITLAYVESKKNFPLVIKDLEDAFKEAGVDYEFNPEDFEEIFFILDEEMANKVVEEGGKVIPGRPDEIKEEEENEKPKIIDETIDEEDDDLSIIEQHADSFNVETE